jgi:hypothetical protein
MAENCRNRWRIREKRSESAKCNHLGDKTLGGRIVGGWQSLKVYALRGLGGEYGKDWDFDWPIGLVHPIK